jgi:hypothetical protein
MQHIHFFYRQELPVPGSLAKAVTYPACEWRPPEGDSTLATQHPLNRYVCSWLTSDMAEVSRCDEVLAAIAQLATHAIQEWFADGDMWCVDFKPGGVQFNPSHVGPEDTAYWNQAEGSFDLKDVQTLLQQWRDFLAQRG